MKPFSLAARVRAATSALVLACLALHSAPVNAQTAGTSSMSPAARARFASQVKALEAFRNSLSPSQSKLPITLLLAESDAIASKTRAALPHMAGNRSVAALESRQSVLLYGEMTPRIKAAIEREGELTGFFPDQGVASANLSTKAMEHIAAATEIKSIVLNLGRFTNKYLTPARAASSFRTNAATGAIVSEGDKTHGAEQARIDFKVSGKGIKVGVISDSSESLAKLIQAGELPTDTGVLTGQGGKGDSEGTAMMEIIHDLAPDAKLEFSTGGSSAAQMAKNILALQKDGCQIIVDDLAFFNESVYQEDVVSTAIRQVSALGVVYLTAIGNSGNRRIGPTATFDGFFVDGGTQAALGTDILNDWNSKGDDFNLVDSGGDSTTAFLYWADAAGKSGNDYNLYDVDPKGNIVSASIDKQTGTGQPIEAVGQVAKGDSLVVTRPANSKALPIRLFMLGGTLEHSIGPTAFGHNMSEFALCVGATPAKVADGPFPDGPFPGPFTANSQIEDFSSTGPRTLYFTPDGAPQTRLIKKPDITAADGVSCATPGFETFYGTSAAAPHAAAIAALAWSQDLKQSGDKIKQRMLGGTIDIGAKGFDDESGNGIVMAPLVLKSIDTAPTPVPKPTEVPRPTPSPTTVPTPIAFAPGSIVFSEPTYSVRENAGTATISVRRIVIGGQGAEGAVSVKFQTATGGTATANIDYQLVSGTLSWASGDSRTKTFTVAIIDDRVREPNETVLLRLYDLIGRGTIARRSATLTILDNERGELDRISPRVVITRPGLESRVSNIDIIAGTASDAGGSGVSSVVLFIQRPSDGKYWSGTEWLAVKTALATTLSKSSTGTSWIRSSGNPTQADLNDDFVKIIAVVRDGAGNTGQTSITVSVDAEPPQVVISSPAKGARLRSLTRATGTVSDAAGDSTIVVFLRRASDQKYWTGIGNEWSSTPTPLSVDLASSGEWTRTKFPVLTTGFYSLTATGTDEVGNSASTTNEFTIGTPAPATGSGGGA